MTDRRTPHGPSRRLRPALLAVGALLGALAVGTTPAQAADIAGAAGVRVPALSWTACAGGLQCATARVPLDYDQPRGAQISLALVRRPATDRAHRIGSLFVNPGGPGGSGVDFVASGAAALWSPQVQARFDVVGFDPRGIGRSSPVRCFPSTAAQSAFFGRTPAFPVGRPQTVAYISTWERFAGRCVAGNAAIMQHMATADVARDLDVLRAAVGDRGLTYDGVSYGSYLGNTYANLFPHHVRALVVDGVLDPVAWSTGRGDGASTPVSLRLGSEQGAAATLAEFLRLCEAGGPRCAFSAGDPAAKYQTLLARAAAGAITVPTPDGPVPVTLSDLVSGVLGGLYAPSVWPLLADQLQQLYRASNGATDTVAAPFARAAVVPYQNGTEAFLGVSCTDSDNPHDPFRWPAAVAPLDRRTSSFASAWAYQSLPCAFWPTTDADRYVGPFTRRTSSPVLVIGNRYDPATPYSGAQTVARMLPSSRLLTLDGWGHTSLGKSSCVDAAVSRYLVRQQLPADGAVCRPDGVPFQAGASAVRSPALDLVVEANRPR